MNGRLHKSPRRTVAGDNEPYICMIHTDRVTIMNRNLITQVNIFRAPRAVRIGYVLAAACCAAIAHAEDTGAKADAKSASVGQSVSGTARQIGKDAKTAAGDFWQGMKDTGKSVAAGAKQGASDIKSGAKQTGAGIASGAKNAGAAAKDGGTKAKNAVAGDKKAD
jgi:hypothetical protein